MILPIDGFREINGIRLRFLAWGSAAASPVVLLHGEGNDAHQWDVLSSALGDAWRALAPEARGIGGSSGAPEAATSMTRLDDLADFVNVMGLDRPVVVAAGDAGVLALRYAAAWPDRARAVITIEAAAHLAGEDWRPLIGRITCPVLMVERDTGGMLNRIAGQFVSSLKDSRSALIENAVPQLLASAPDATARVIRAFLDDVMARTPTPPPPPRPLDLA